VRQRRIRPPASQIANVLQALTSFELFDTLTREGENAREALAVVVRLLRAELGLSAPREAIRTAKTRRD
jgi:hypothetical protein